MATAKKRINISLRNDTALFLKQIALRDEVPAATKAAELIEKALEIEEDEYFAKIAAKRDVKGAKYYSHEEAWGK